MGFCLHNSVNLGSLTVVMKPPPPTLHLVDLSQILWCQSKDYIFWIFILHNNVHNVSPYWALYYCKIISESWLRYFYKVLTSNKVSTAILSLFGRAQNYIFSAFSPRIGDRWIWKAYGENRGPWLTFWIYICFVKNVSL